MGTFYVGSNQQPIRAIFDTGSANSWILGKEAIEPDQTEFQPFDHETSKTFEYFSPKKSVHISFGSGDLHGSFAKDQALLGNPNSGNTLKIEHYEFGLVEEQEVFSNFDAIVGLAYPTMAERNVTPFFDVLM